MEEKPALDLEELTLSGERKGPRSYAYRARVPGGWLVFTATHGWGLSGVAFYPDPTHAWNGSSGSSGGNQEFS